MPTSEARVATTRGTRYLTQLLKHFSHKTQAEWTDERGSVRIGESGLCTLVVEPDALVLRAEAADEEGLGRVEHVVGSHLLRFATHDELVVTWTRAVVS
jgi:hypothetical protein